MPRTPDPKYETILRETQRRVERPARDADLVAILRGMRALDHRDGELERIEGILGRATRRVKGMRKRLTEERDQLGAASDRETVDRLLTCEVVHDARQGGVIFVRIKGTSDVIDGSERPVSSDERNVIAKLQAEPPSDKDDEKLAARLNLSEYLPDTEPCDVQAQVDAALNASCLPDELQEALLTLEQEDEAPPPKTKKPKAKAEKASKAAADKPKGKGRGKKIAAEPPPAPVAAAAPATDEQPEPGPAEMEKDQPDMPRPPTPRPPAAEPQPPLDEEPILSTDEAEPAEDATVDGEPEQDVLADDAAGDGADVLADDKQVEPEASAAEEPAEAVEEPAEEKYPGAFDADGEEDEEEWDDAAEPPPVAATEVPVAAQEAIDELTVDRTGVVDDAPAEEPAAAPALAPEPVAQAPVVAAPAPTAPEPEPAVAPTKPKKKAAPAPKDGAAEIGMAPSAGPIDQAAPARAAAAAAVQVAKVAPSPAPAPAAPPAAPTTSPALTVDNNFGLSPAIAKKFGEAILHFVKEPMCASTAAKTLEKRLGSILTTQMRDAVIPMLHHLAGAGQVERKSAGDDFIFYLKEQEKGIDAWYVKHKRANA